MSKMNLLKQKRIWFSSILIVLVLAGGYCFKNVYYRTAIIRTFAKGSWFIDSEKDTIYTMESKSICMKIMNVYHYYLKTIVFARIHLLLAVRLLTVIIFMSFLVHI